MRPCSLTRSTGIGGVAPCVLRYSRQASGAFEIASSNLTADSGLVVHATGSERQRAASIGNGVRAKHRCDVQFLAQLHSTSTSQSTGEEDIVSANASFVTAGTRSPVWPQKVAFSRSDVKRVAILTISRYSMTVFDFAKVTASRYGLGITSGRGAGIWQPPGRPTG